MFCANYMSQVSCTRCHIADNFALTAGVISVSVDGVFNMIESTLTRNMAISNPITLVTDSAKQSVIQQSTIYDNHMVESHDVMSEAVECE